MSDGKLESILAKIPLFSGLSREEYQTLLHACRVVRYPADTTIFNQGDTGLDMYIVLAGRVEIRNEYAGLLHTMNPGDLFGEIALVSQVRRTATAVACGDATLLRVSRQDIDSLVGKAPRVSYLVMRHTAEVLAERLIDTTWKAGFNYRLELAGAAAKKDSGSEEHH